MQAHPTRPNQSEIAWMQAEAQAYIFNLLISAMPLLGELDTEICEGFLGLVRSAQEGSLYRADCLHQAEDIMRSLITEAEQLGQLSPAVLGGGLAGRLPQGDAPVGRLAVALAAWVDQAWEIAALLEGGD